ncbi:hypothetical protein [Vibrio vulnificus]|uniref:hypothetical protein n=1 Tax=Vibrio vulnificus TaxID=672 RepID=UPI0032428104
MSIIKQMKSTVSQSALYKPSVLAKLLNRPDVSLFTEFQSDVSLEEKTLVLSHYFSSHIGLIVDGINCYVGIPSVIWPAIKRFNWQSYDVDTDFGRLYLNYDVEVEKIIVVPRSYGNETKKHITAERLRFALPAHPVLIKQVRSTSILHICSMTSEQTRNEAIPPISITKVHKPVV